MEAHYDEVARLKAVLGRPDIDLEKYRELQRKGELALIGAYCGDAMVGYVFVVLSQHPHYKSVKVAVDDMHYLSPEYRQGMTGKTMLEVAEARARTMGAKVFTMRCKAGSGHGILFERMGYELTDLVYVKDLTHAL